MQNTFAIVGSVASIIALGIVLRTEYKKKRERENKKQDFLNQQQEDFLDFLASTGTNVSGRTDLGFFAILLQNRWGAFLSSQEMRLHRAYIVTALLLTIGTSTAVILAAFENPPVSSNVLLIVIIAVSMLLLVSIFAELKDTRRLRKRKESFELRMMEVWFKPIESRSK